MTRAHQPAYFAASPLPHLTYPAVQDAVSGYARQHELAQELDDGSWISVGTSYGTYRFVAEDAGVRAEVSASRADWHRMLKDNLADMLEHYAPDTAAAIHWSDAEGAGARPANFQLMNILSVTPLGRNFLRIETQAQDLSSFNEDSIHFRLALPKPGNTEPEWPVVTEGGTTRWPSGAKSLHRPVYTARFADPVTSILTFDVFIHEGGRTTAWAQSASPGQVIGLTGPGGGGVPQTEKISIYSDETGFPAVARLMEALPETVSGYVILQAGEAGAYDLPHHPGLTVEWAARPDGSCLAETAISALPQDPQHFLWFTAERAQTQKLRAHCKSIGLDTKAHYIAAYWTASQ